MTKKDFFIMIVKLFGLFSIVTALFNHIPSYISYFMMDMDSIGYLWSSLMVLLIIGLFVLLLFKANWIVRVLKLDKGFDDEFINLEVFKVNDLLKVGIFIIGGFLIIDSIPVFLSHLHFYLKGDVFGFEYNERDKFNLVNSAINIVLGLFFVFKFEQVAKLFKRK